MTRKKSQPLWCKLRVGDRIRLVEIPPEFRQEGYYIHRDTMRVYKRLLARRRSLRVSEIDEYRIPWIRCRFRRRDGRIDYHSLAINHDGLLRVVPRRSQ